jgi:hypothetical protein
MNGDGACEASAESVGVFADAPVTETAKPACPSWCGTPGSPEGTVYFYVPDDIGRRRYCDHGCRDAAQAKAPPVVEKAKCTAHGETTCVHCGLVDGRTREAGVDEANPLTCIRFECERADSTVVMRIMRKDAAPEPICAECYVAADLATAKLMPTPKPRPAAHPGVIAQVVSPFVGIWASRGMRW